MTIKRRVFYSFHFARDAWRASQVREMGVLEGNEPASDNDWEDVKKGGDTAIKSWINSQLKGRTCAVVLIGSQTASRRWINYEIKKAWDFGMGVVGIYINHLRDKQGRQSTKGCNPFYHIKTEGKPFSNIVKDYNPPSSISTKVYEHIQYNIAGWIEEAIKIRKSQ